MDDVLDRALGVEEAAAHLGRVVTLGEEAQDRRLALGQAGEREPARRQDLALELADLAQQPAQEVRGQRALAGSRGPDRQCEVVGRGLAAPDDAGDAGLGSREQPLVVDPGDEEDHLRGAPRTKRADLRGDRIGDVVRHHQGHAVDVWRVAGADDETLRAAQLAHDPGLGERVRCGHVDPDRRVEGNRLGNHSDALP